MLSYLLVNFNISNAYPVSLDKVENATIFSSEQSSTYGSESASLADDGNTQTCSVAGFGSQSSEIGWWRADLGMSREIIGFSILSSSDPYEARYLTNFSVLIEQTASVLPSINVPLVKICLVIGIPFFSVLGGKWISGTCIDFPIYGRYFTLVRNFEAFRQDAIALCEIDIIVLKETTTTNENPTLFKNCRQSSTYNNYVANLAVDNNINTCSLAGEGSNSINFGWWQVDLAEIIPVYNVSLLNNPNYYESQFLTNFAIIISFTAGIIDDETPKQFISDPNNKPLICTIYNQQGLNVAPGTWANFSCALQPITGQYLTIMRLQGFRQDAISLCEIKVNTQSFITSISTSKIPYLFSKLSNIPTYKSSNVAINTNSNFPITSQLNPISVFMKSVNITTQTISTTLLIGKPQRNTPLVACQSFQYQCIGGNCIYKTWLCDGVKDCPQGDDENATFCDKCASNQFHCHSNNQCIDHIEVCDGSTQCQDGSDESDCIILDTKQSGLIIVNYSGQSNFIFCNDYWSKEISNSVCQLTGHGSASSTTNIIANENSSFLLVMDTYNSTKSLLSQVYYGLCQNKMAVVLSCFALACGTRSNNSASNYGPYIIGGDIASSGAWPWQVQILKYSQMVCGGSLLNNQWVLTAAHCVYDTTSPNNTISNSYIQVAIGSNKLYTVPDPNLVIFFTSKIIIHPNFNFNTYSSDLALIKLNVPISKFSDYVRPVCIPTPNVNLNFFKVCIITGFGYTTSADKVSQNLMQGKVDLMSYQQCLNNLKSIYGQAPPWLIDDNTMICTGSIPTLMQINSCKGDSGGPLVCQDQNNVWSLVGAASFSVSYDARECTNSVYTRISTFNVWIKAIIT